MIDLPKVLFGNVVAVVCHDAGAANYIISWLRAAPEINVRAAMAGPAERLWAKAFPEQPNYALEDALEGSTLLLSGSGWASTFEHEARIAACGRMKSVAVVDHWVNYPMRFERDEIVLPDEIWVADSYALDIAKRQFPELTIRQLPNLYLAGEVAAIQRAGTSATSDAVLYALEPVRLQWSSDDTRPGEFQALDYFLTRLPLLGLPADTPIRLRPHPSDPPGKYDAWLAQNTRYNLTLDATTPLAEEMARANWIVGLESFVLVIGVAAGRKVVSTLPPWGHECRLPHEEVIHLKALEAGK